MADHNLPDPLRPLGQKLRELGDLVGPDVPSLEELLDRHAEEADGTEAMLKEAEEALERVRGLAAEWAATAREACDGEDHGGTCADCNGRGYSGELLAVLDGGTEADRG